MEFKGTQGIWEVKTGSTLIGIFAKDKQIGIIQGFNREENSKLIAAAPEMLEMLMKISEFMPENKDIKQLIKKATTL